MQKWTLIALVLSIAALCIVMLVPPLVPHGSARLANHPVNHKTQLVWCDDLQSAYDLTQKCGKNVYVEVGAPSCGSCRRLEQYVYPDARVQEFLDASYVCVKLDMESSDASKLSWQYQVIGLPQLYVFDANGHLKGKAATVIHSADRLIDVVTKLTRGEDI